MEVRMLSMRFSLAAIAVSAVASVLSGCASPVVDAQWRNVELPPSYLRGASVLVSCETPDIVIKQICEDQVAADLSARGAMPMFPAPGSVAPMQPGTGDAQYLTSARSAGAKAVMSVTVGLSSQRVDQGVSVGIGGFGFGRGGGGGIGLSAPIGGGRRELGLFSERAGDRCRFGTAHVDGACKHAAIVERE